MKIERYKNKIIITHISWDLKKYQCQINNTDIFVVNFCNSNLENMEKILRNGKIMENENYYLLKIIVPFHLDLILEKESDGIISTYFHPQPEDYFKKFEEENKYLKEKLKKIENVIANLTTRIGDGVFLPGYSNGIIDQSCTQLRLTNSLTFYIQFGFKVNTFAGKSIEPLKRLENLQEIMFENYNGFDFDLTHLKDCKKLRKIIFSNCFNYILPDFGREVEEINEENKKIFVIGE